jgi:lysylphosphatidylglycerol synthetase-like protein (DUF2156 family)
MSAVARPVGVTIVGILIVISGILIIIGGVMNLFNEEVRLSVSIVVLILMLVIGLIYLAVAKGIFDGNNFARLLVGVITVINLLVGLYHAIFVELLRWNGVVQAVIALIILGLLFSRRATEFFTSS